MSLDFLSPRPLEVPPARSPFLDAALAAGARSTLRDGWEVVDSSADGAAETAACHESVGFADRSELGKLELQAPVADFLSGTAVRSAEGWRCPVRPDRELVICQAADAAVLRERLAADARVVDLTATFSALTIAGPRTRDAIAQFCALDLREASLPVGGFRPGSVARTPGFVLREGPDRFLLLTGAAYAGYVWETVAAAAMALGGRPVGAAALPELDLEVADA